MNLFSKSTPLTIRLALLLAVLIVPAACNAPTGVPDVPELPTVEVTLPAVPSLPSLPMVYYYFASIPGNTFPAGSVEIVPDQLILSPNLVQVTRTDDVATNVRVLLQAMIDDPRNPWTGVNLTITNVTYENQQVTVELSGEINAAGDVVLIAARYQFLMTVFTETSVQTAVILVNGQNIDSLGASQANAVDLNHVYTRSEVEFFMAQNALNP